MYEQYMTYFYTYILPPIVTLVAGVISGYILRAKKWWGNKTVEEQKNALKDAIACLQDGRISADDINMLIDKHIYKVTPTPAEVKNEPIEDE